MRRLFLILAIFLWAAALGFVNLAEKNGSGIFLQLDRAVTGTEVAEIAAREAEEESPAGFCFYTVREGEWLTCPENGQWAKAAAVLVSGNAALLGAEPLAWSSGCVLDSQTAQSLFGTDAVGDQQVTFGGNTRTVSGTNSALAPTAIVSAGERDSLDQCVLPGFDENGAETAQQFLLRHDLSGQVLNFYPLLVFAKNLCLLPLWLLLFSLCRLAQKRAKWLCWLTAVIGIALLGSRINISSDAVPSVWSDFSFWGHWLQGQKENLLGIFSWATVDRALQMEQNMVKSMLCALAGTAAMALGGRR